MPDTNDDPVEVPWRIAALVRLDTAMAALAEARKVVPLDDAAGDWIDDSITAVDEAREILKLTGEEASK